MRLLVALVFLSVAACGPDVRGPASTPKARSFAAGPPPAAGQGPACEAGLPDECVRAADALAGDDQAEAERLWLAGCKHGDATGCERLMHESASEPELADDYGRMACELGSESACGMTAQSLFLRSREHRDRGLLERAGEMAARGCELEAWDACWLAAIVYGELDNEERGLWFQRRAALLASRACAGTDAPACEALAAHAHANGNEDNAGRLFARACGLELVTSTSPESRQRTREDVTCQRARLLGAEVPTEIVVPRDAARWLAAEKMSLRRISGRTQIVPHPEVKIFMKRRGQSRIFARLQLRVTERGVVSQIRILESSGYPAYDRQVFDAVRAWRYRPYAHDGEPADVRSRLLVIYNQRN